MKKLATLLMMAGLVFLIYGGYQYFTVQAKESGATREAEALIAERAHAPEDKSTVMAAFDPALGETIGLLEIDKIDARVPIIEGSDAESLDRGVGHYETTAFPGQGDQILLSGHRDTVFTKLGEVEVGDIITIELPYGRFDYKMVASKIVDADDRTVIGSTAPNEELIVSTCYPFGFVGSAPDRYVVYAVPVESEGEAK